MAGVVIKNVSKVFAGDVVAVDDVSLEIADRELMVLVGPSGCGKSTVLRMIAGLEEATTGEIRIGERVVNDVSPKDRDVAMVFQNYALYPHMSVYDNMAFGLKVRKLPKDEIRTRVRDAATILGLEDLLDRKPRALSGGQRQRVAVGRAIVRNPKVFLFDEPLSNLDAALRALMRIEISRLHQRLQATVIYVTHDQVEAMTLGDRIAVINNGRIQQVDTPMRLYDQPANRFVAGFLGSPSMNFVEGQLVAESGGEFRAGQLTVPVPERIRSRPDVGGGREVILGIRPEDIHLVTDGKSQGGSTFKGSVDVVEPVGNEQLLHVVVDGHPMVCRVAAARSVSVADEIMLEINPERVHFFDAKTQEALV
ncbi:MAG: sn-glycerol-3-phosphate ABC transporter ATP-binding protein UgpC [Candidatus Eisenbacteria sp.]|nr:sn-glycerol-3-phosphate ABC transporter ATP-binding protein UgpC [Candidatus Eisenbacteria bacterium]